METAKPRMGRPRGSKNKVPEHKFRRAHARKGYLDAKTLEAKHGLTKSCISRWARLGEVKVLRCGKFVSYREVDVKRVAVNGFRRDPPSTLPCG